MAGNGDELMLRDGERMERIGFRMPVDACERARAIASAEGVSIGSVMRDAALRGLDATEAAFRRRERTRQRAAQKAEDAS